MHFARIVRAALLVPAPLIAVGFATSTGAAGAAVACEVDYTITNQWPGGFRANITTTNLGDPLSAGRWSGRSPAGRESPPSRGTARSPRPAARCG